MHTGREVGSCADHRPGLDVARGERDDAWSTGGTAGLIDALDAFRSNADVAAEWRLLVDGFLQLFFGRERQLVQVVEIDARNAGFTELAGVERRGFGQP